jgi:hypothetical protein
MLKINAYRTWLYLRELMTDRFCIYGNNQNVMSVDEDRCKNSQLKHLLPNSTAH